MSGSLPEGGKGGNADFDPSPWTGEYGHGGHGGHGGWAHAGEMPAWFRDTPLAPGAGGSSPASGSTLSSPSGSVRLDAAW